MGALLFHIAFISIGAAVGAAAGWLLRGSSPPKAASEPVPQESEKSLDMVETVMSRLHQLTVSVAADVGEHSNRVQAINHELTGGGADVVSVVERLVQANEQMQTQLKAAEQRMQQQSQEIESHMKEARTDALTKLSNRRAFDDEIRRCVEQFRAQGQPACVMMIDIDHFKKINDTYGHQAGDEVLRNIGRVLRRDASGQEVVCRYGGEEFAVIYVGLDLAAVIPRAEKVRAAIAEEVIEVHGLDLKVTASAGVAQLLVNESDEMLVKRADMALYAGKENGRNRGYWHDGTTSRPMKSNPQPGPPATERAANRPLAPTKTVGTRSTPDSSVFRLVDNVETPPVHRRDRLAGLSDQETFCRDLDRRLAKHQRDRAVASLLLLVIDNCPAMDDLYGAKAVELAQRTTAQMMKASMREMDHAARFDDQTLALILPGAGAAEAGILAERLRIAVQAKPLPMNGDSFQITVSMGLAEFGPHDEREKILERARLALSAAIKAGGNRMMAITADGDCRSLVATNR